MSTGRKPTWPGMRPDGMLKIVDPLLGAAFNKIGDRAAAGLRTFLEAAPADA